MADQDQDRAPAPGTSCLERITAALGALLLLGVCGVLTWDGLSRDGQPASFTFAVLDVTPLNGRYLVHFKVRNVGDASAQRVAVHGRLASQPPETARLIFDFLAAGQDQDGHFLFTADPRAFPLELVAESFSKP